MNKGRKMLQIGNVRLVQSLILDIFHINFSINGKPYSLKVMREKQIYHPMRLSHGKTTIPIGECEFCNLNFDLIPTQCVKFSDAELEMLIAHLVKRPEIRLKLLFN